ncbi:MAG: arylsulfatase [Planctomycetaceae bacterium]|nr:arylsulfatase [Planctomycetaceae bacterium]
MIRLLRSLCLVLFFAPALTAAERPNVILIMTDDQGYGDLACHGNQQIKTPHIDKLHSDSVRLTDYHVDPTCSPTRSALMTGRYSTRTGVWHTIMGRSIMHKDEVTLGDVFSEGGYTTGCFGKWHLGENYPYRPQDRGFDEVVIHGGGGVGQTPDFWGNNYFDDTYWHNGKPEKQTGYCTDVFFDHALSFIEANKEKPFFVYLPTNAAHGPFLVADKYSQPYKEMGIKSPRAEFYGMITNIDENVGRMREKLTEWGLDDNTLLIFTTDNGTAAGHRDGGYNAGMRAAKGSEYEGGHRVPCFWYWKGKLYGGRDVDQLTAHIDMLPTLADFCDLKVPEDRTIDGKSIRPLLEGQEDDWKERVITVHSQRIEHPEKWRKSAVMTERWRLINGQELYDIVADPGQKSNVASGHPNVVKRLVHQYDQWWESIDDRFGEYVPLYVGSQVQNPVLFTAHDWHTDQREIPWNQPHIQRDLPGSGTWIMSAYRAGKYRFTFRNRPPGVDHPLEATRIKIKVGEKTSEALLDPNQRQFYLVTELPEGEFPLQTWMDCTDGKTRGAYYVTVEFIE